MQQTEGDRHVDPQLPDRFARARGELRLGLGDPVGVIFAAHGAQKLFGWFGGYGLEGTSQFFASVGVNPGYLVALLAGLAELFGGLALVVGVLVRPAAASLAFAMLVFSGAGRSSVDRLVAGDR